MRLDGKVAVITGASSGFGQATAVRLAEEGASIVFGDVDEAGATVTTERVEATGRPVEFACVDVATAAGAGALIDLALGRHGAIDVLVNNAGVAQPEQRQTWDASEESWDRVLRINLKSVYLCCRATLPGMLERRRGSIINVASIAATRAVGGASYAAAKGGILSYTRLVSREVAAAGVRVNAVSPGFMRTPMSSGERMGLTADQQQERLGMMERRVPMRRLGSTADIAEALVYLASDASAYVTGQEIIVDGGYVAG